MKDKISIVIPVYNVENYLKKCLDSIISQSYKNIEIILVNDGSTDGSGIICDKYKKIDNRIRVIHKKNGGVSSARNVGIKEATGSFICFADADDYLMEDYIEYLYKLIISNDSDISLTTEMFGNFDNNQSKNENITIVNGEDACERILCYRIPIGVYSKMFKTDFIKKNNILFFEDIFMGEGFNFNVMSFQRARKVTISNRKIYYYRRDNSTSATTKFSIKKCENSIYALDVMKQRFVIKSNRIENAWKYAKWRTYSDAFDYMVLGKAQKEYKEEYILYKKYIKSNAKSANLVPISKKDRIRAKVMSFVPEIIPVALKIRRLKYNIKI